MIFLLLVSLVIFNKLVHKSYLNPIFLQSVVWLVYYALLAANIGAYDVYLKNVDKFLIYQSIGFSLGGFVSCLFVKSETVLKRQAVNKSTLETAAENVLLFYPFVFLILIGCVLYQIKSAGTFSIFEITDFRSSLAEDDGKKSGTIGTIHLLVTVYIVIYIATVNWNKRNLFKHIPLIALYFYFTLLLASKGQFVLFFCSLLYILAWLKKIRKSQIIVAGIVLAGIIFFLLYLGIGGGKGAFTQEAFIDILLTYTITSLPALHLSQSPPTQYFGYYTFRVVYVWLNKFGWSFSLSPVLSEFVSTPLPTNVYSYIKPYYQDFGFTGIFLIPAFLGAAHNFFYFKAQRGQFVYVILSAFLIYPLVMQVFEENYFRQLSNWFYIFIIILLLTKIKFRLNGFSRYFNFNN